MADAARTGGVRQAAYAAVDPLPAEYMEDYWNSVRRTFSEVFGAKDKDIVKAISTLKARIDRAPRDTALHFFHLEPLQVAADYLGRGEITSEQIQGYMQLRASDSMDRRTRDAGPAPSATGGAAPSGSPADVEAVLTGLAEKHPQKLDWRHSIVDLMKLLDLDSNLASREQLADELHYTGDKDDSASMNIWLHKQVMQKLAENGGEIPEDLKH